MPRGSASSPAAGAVPRADPPADLVLTLRSLAALATAEQACHRCDLYRDATQAVPGRGPRRAMLVGEQPGDSEDRAGEPFVGPAGRVLAELLAAAELDLDDAFVTSAVKHFTFELRGKRRSHTSPAVREIEACSVWLERALALVQPRIVVALGASAGRALLRRRVVLRDERRQLQPFADQQLPLTIHPSYLLRIPDRNDRARERERFVADLAIARGVLRRLPAPPSAPL